MRVPPGIVSCLCELIDFGTARLVEHAIRPGVTVNDAERGSRSPLVSHSLT